jgi:xylan 1,4-beta-xylosidase
LFPIGVARDEHFVITKAKNGDIRGIAWNHLEEGGEVTLELSFAVDDGTYLWLTKMVDEELCNPLKAWLDMGSPAYPTARQLELLRECARPLLATKRLEVEEEVASATLRLPQAALCYFELTAVTPEADRGYDAKRVPGGG